MEAEDSKFASRVLEEEKVLIERQAGQEAADKELAKKMQRKHMKPLREATEALIKIWSANASHAVKSLHSAMLCTDVPLNIAGGSQR